MKPELVCKKSGKRKYKSPGQTRRAVAAKGYKPGRVYRCQHCDSYHWTSQDATREDVDQSV